VAGRREAEEKCRLPSHKKKGGFVGGFFRKKKYFVRAREKLHERERKGFRRGKGEALYNPGNTPGKKLSSS